MRASVWIKPRDRKVASAASMFTHFEQRASLRAYDAIVFFFLGAIFLEGVTAALLLNGTKGFAGTAQPNRGPHDPCRILLIETHSSNADLGALLITTNITGRRRTNRERRTIGQIGSIKLLRRHSIKSPVRIPALDKGVHVAGAAVLPPAPPAARSGGRRGGYERQQERGAEHGGAEVGLREDEHAWTQDSYTGSRGSVPGKVFFEWQGARWFVAQRVVGL